MYMYVRQVMRSLAAAGGRFHGYVGQYMSLLTPVDALSASGLVVSLLVISISLGSSPPRTSGLSDTVRALSLWLKSISSHF